MRVLIAEDDLVSRTLLLKAIQRLGHLAETAIDGEEAWEKYTATGADVVLTDWGMPGLDGAELCRRVRERPYAGTPYTYIVFLTAHGGADYRTAAMMGGADDFLTKPLDSDALEACLIAADRVTSLHAKLHGQAQALRESEAILRAFYDSTGLSMGIVELMDGEEDILHVSANAETARLYGTTPEGMRNRRASEVGTPPERIRNLLYHYRRCQSENGPVTFEYEREIWSIPGATRWMSAILSCIGLGDTGRMRFAYVIQDITERKRMELFLQGENAELEVLVTRDALTGVANRRGFEETLEEAVAHSRRQNEPISLLLLDVDNFKPYNDTFGHPAGDTALKTVAQLLTATARECDLVARYGGEEFAILLPHTDPVDAVAMAEKFRLAVATHPWSNRPVTVSIGTATLSPLRDGKEELLERADEALYAAKRGGRNRVQQGKTGGSLSHPLLTPVR